MEAERRAEGKAEAAVLEAATGVEALAVVQVARAAAKEELAEPEGRVEVQEGGEPAGPEERVAVPEEAGAREQLAIRYSNYYNNPLNQPNILLPEDSDIGSGEPTSDGDAGGRHRRIRDSTTRMIC